MNPVTNWFGDKFWYNSDGQYHREDGPACDYIKGPKEWRRNGELHRVDGPAIEHTNGSLAWYFENQLHRTCGPAITRLDGSNEYWIHGEQISENEFNFFFRQTV